MSTWLHSPTAHMLAAVLASLASFGVEWLINAINAGTVPLSPALVAYQSLITGALTIVLFSIRDAKERSEKPATPIKPELPVEPAGPNQGG